MAQQHGHLHPKVRPSRDPDAHCVSQAHLERSGVFLHYQLGGGRGEDAQQRENTDVHKLPAFLRRPAAGEREAHGGQSHDVALLRHAEELRVQGDPGLPPAEDGAVLAGGEGVQAAPVGGRPAGRAQGAEGGQGVGRGQRGFPILHCCVWCCCLSDHQCF